MSGRPGLLRRLDDTGVPLLITRLVLGGLFVYMGWNKTMEPVDFMKMIHEYYLVPDSAYIVLNLIAVTLPWIEMLCGVLLIAGVMIRGSALILLLMLTVFTVAVIWRAVNIYSAGGIAFCEIKFDCGCGAGEEWICQKVPENVGLWLLSLIALVSRSRNFCLRRRSPLPAPEVLTENKDAG